MGQMLQGVGDPFEHLPIARPAWRPRSAQARARKSRGVARTRLTFARQKEGGSEFWDLLARTPHLWLSGIRYHSEGATAWGIHEWHLLYPVDHCDFPHY